ncbi:MAG: hypothetical protein M1839_009382 [Geoglossum umbratile]|nr:MAG: hypothetical protein M1839_009382 [Geoglossum umbratile]
MLGRLRMKVEECIQKYPEIARNVFTKPRVASWHGMPKEKYNHKFLQREVEKIVQERTPTERTRNSGFDRYPSPDDLCRTVVVANEISQTRQHEGVFIFRTYNHRERYHESRVRIKIKNPGPAHNHMIWQVARATSAAPRYFKEIEIEGRKYSDGAVGHNNPAELASEEVLIKEGVFSSTPRGLPSPILLIVSIGTGQTVDRIERVRHRLPKLSDLLPIRKTFDLLHRITERIVDVDDAHDRLKFQMRRDSRDYYRWTGGPAIGALELDEWRVKSKPNKPSTQEFIENHVDQYLEDENV